MLDMLGYKDKTVVITGAASGMGAAAAELLLQLGAEVHTLDIAPVELQAANCLRTDMKDMASLDAAIGQLPGEIHALFNCAGVPSPPFAAIDTVLINFSGLRYLSEALAQRMQPGAAIASIASTAGMGWKPQLETVHEFLALDPNLESARNWLESNPDRCADGYGFSKQCIIVYTMSQAASLAQRGIRINCIAPSPTDSAFMAKLKGEGQIPDEAVELFLPPNGKYASGSDMAAPLVWLNSDLAGFVSGVNLPVDFGYCGQVLSGQRDDLLGITT